MLSAGIEFFLAFVTASKRVGFPSMSGPPLREATSIALMSLAKFFARRNAFGRQVDSFESDISAPEISSSPIRAVFIRAPWVEKVGENVHVLANYKGSDGLDHVVAVRQGHLLATAFHPEITDDFSVHQYFLLGSHE